jgi:hypothetical protein
MVDLGQGFYIGNNDSGNPAELIRFKMSDVEGAERIRIQGASNTDWEELASDEQYVYIGDTGNNSGTRRELMVYRVRKSDLYSGDQVQSEKIQFEYPKRKNFKPTNEHNYDCEAMICAGDSLFVFTKNRGNGKTDVYGFPKAPGMYTATHHGSFDVGGLVTGADFRRSGGTGELALIGYTFKDKGYHPFVLYFRNINAPEFFKQGPSWYSFDGKLQTETILFGTGNSLLISNEEEHGDKGFIYRVNLD